MKMLILRFVWWLLWLKIWPPNSRDCDIRLYETEESANFGPLTLCHTTIFDRPYSIVQLYFAGRKVLEVRT